MCSVEIERCMSPGVNQGCTVNFSSKILILWSVCHCKLTIIPLILNIEFAMLCCRLIGLEME